MEITEGCIDKFYLAKVIMKPPVISTDAFDMEMVFLSQKIPGRIHGYLTLGKDGRWYPRSHGVFNGEVLNISSLARRRIRGNMKQIAIRLMAEVEGDMEKWLTLS